jgi:hypothetical protein
MKFLIQKKESDESWTLIEELEDDLALVGRLQELRIDGSVYIVEKRDGFISTILDL